MTNPVANADQFAAEEEVRAMWALPVVMAARAQAAAHWRIAYGRDIPAEAEPAFEAAMDEYVANYLFKAAACDPLHPRFVRNFMAPYAWNGGNVPGARMGGDNPDNCYRLAGIAHGERYVVHVTPIDRPPAHVSFTLVGNWGTSVTIRTIEWHKLDRDANGGARIVIDGEPADGRANHMATTPNTKFLFVRDSMADWACETPLQLDIERIGMSAGVPLPLEQRAGQAAFRLVEEIPLYYWFTRLFSGRPVNRLDNPAAVDSVGGLVQQASAMGHFHLEADQAAIIRYDPAGAAYCGPTLYNWWFQSIDAGYRSSSLTAAMSVPDADGCITCVASIRDPGVANWLDTGGLRHTLPLVRWQGLPETPVRGGPRLSVEIVPFDALDDLPRRGMARVDPAGRAAQIAARRAAYQRRVVS